MKSRISVGPPGITIHRGDTFLLAAPNGDISDASRHGLFARDTRLLSGHRISIAGRPWTHVTSAKLDHDHAAHYLLSPEIKDRQQNVEKCALELRLDRILGQGLTERLQVTSYASSEVRVHLAIALMSDFADVFDVKSELIADRGEINTVWDADRNILTTRYRHQAFERALSCHVEVQSGATYANGHLRFELEIAPKQTWSATLRFTPVFDSENADDLRRLGWRYAWHSRQTADRTWIERAPRLDPRTGDVAKAYHRAVHDIGSLSLLESTDGDGFVPAGGLPWFVALFGRDSIATSLESLMVGPEAARGTLALLASTQARDRDDRRDAQPGKIVHEMRVGELAMLGLLPHARYYGEADATTLYLVLLSEAWRWTGDDRLLHRHRDTAMRCLEWIDKYGDLDGDGFQEYKTFAEDGYHNQSWKDSGKALVYPDGRIVPQPIATCELQGYVFLAKRRMADVLAHLGDSAGHDQLSSEAARLREQFEAAFWMEAEGTYAFALDPDKRQVASIASNPGRLLWTGIVSDRDRARRVVDRLLQPDMFCGWGVRTLAASHPSYNPHSYQLGSVWPQDNAFIAAGARRYGHWREANRICEGMFAACAQFEGWRLPEVFAGLDRDACEIPVQHLGAGWPQAWAAGSVPLMLQTILGLEPDAPQASLRVSPRLPEWLGEIELKGMRVGGATVSLRFTGVGEASRAEVTDLEGQLEILSGDASWRAGADPV